ncbi:MAG TPA: ribonuclease E activity regulator RraA [Gemmatimonadales bacterium]|nr:ribonuclease E activity regulator RraA [Gemmatimonadales bacterium]
MTHLGSVEGTGVEGSDAPDERALAGAATTPEGWATADLCDAHPDTARPLAPGFQDYGGRAVFEGIVSTVQVRADYRPVLAALQEEGHGRVLLVDGGGIRDRAILGERLLTMAHARGWAGVVVFGAVRDTRHTRTIPVGLRALGTFPRRGDTAGPHARDVAVEVAGVRVVPGDRLYADTDGIVVLAAGAA